MYASKIVALFFGLAATGAMASDVYAIFYNSGGAIEPHFDVSNPGCFSIPDPINVAFNQHANGPYCLHSFNQGGCKDLRNLQQFGDLNTGTHYGLTAPGAASYMWKLGSC